MTETNNILEPPHWVCEICNDDGKCLANESHPDYEFDASDGLGYFDCWNYILKRDKEKIEVTMQTVRHLIEWKQAKKKDKVFLYIFGNAKIRELIAFLTKNNIQACAVVNKISDDGTTKKVIGEIGWDEISRNISTILDDPVSKHRSNKHQISDNRTLLNVKSALGKKRIFCVTNQKESFYATITPDDLLDYYETIINPFYLLREIEILIRVILEKLDHQLDEETPLGDAVKALLDEKIYGKIPYDYPKKELSRLLNEAVKERNLFFHHKVENTETKDLKTLWQELKYIFEKLHK